MLRLRIAVFSLLLCMVVASVSQAGPFRRRARRTAPVVTQPVRATVAASANTFRRSLQVVAQARADAMARQGNLTHGIHHYADCPSYPSDVAEGIGYGGSPQCATCTFRGRSVVADAAAQSSNGMWYRVRFWQ